MTNPGTRSAGAAERRAWILASLRAVGFLSIADLARELSVSQMTIRRDLHMLEGAGDVRLVHGGAGLVPRALRGSALPDDGHAAARERIAARAVDLIDPTDTVAIDAGATAHAVALALPEGFGGCVITHPLPVLQLRTSCPGARVVALGGELLPGRHAFAGPTTEAALTQLRVRTLFLAPSGIDARGMYAHSPAEASIQRRLMAIADVVVLVAADDAFESSAPVRIAPLERLRAVVTDRRPPAEVAGVLRRAGVDSDVVA